MFGEYLADPFCVEAVEVIEADGNTRLTPDFTPRTASATLAYLNSAVGVPIDPDNVVGYLQRMSLPGVLSEDKVHLQEVSFS